MDNRTTIRVPRKYQDRINDIICDSDGYWVALNKGWYWDDPGLHIIHEDTQAEVLQCISNTMPCVCNYCKGLED